MSELKELIADDLAAKVARICGPHSGAAKALAERDRRRALGEACHVLNPGNGVWLVGPDPLALLHAKEQGEARDG